MASSGKLRLGRIFKTTMIVLLAATAWPAFAGDGPDRGMPGRCSPARRTRSFHSARCRRRRRQRPPRPHSPTVSKGHFPAPPGRSFTTPEQPMWIGARAAHRKSAGSYSIWCAAAGSASPGSGGDVPAHSKSWAVAGPFDFSGATSGEFQFDLWLSTEANYDYFKWLASTDGSSFSGLQTTATTSGFQTVTVDLSDWGSAGNRPRPVPGLDRVYLPIGREQHLRGRLCRSGQPDDQRRRWGRQLRHLRSDRG